MPSIRVVVQHTPSLFALLGLCDAATLRPVITLGDHTYYRAETHAHFVLYRAALSGWGAAAPNPNDSRPVFDANQR